MDRRRKNQNYIQRKTNSQIIEAYLKVEDNEPYGIKVWKDLEQMARKSLKMAQKFQVNIQGH